jgi:hypothetical protein
MANVLNERLYTLDTAAVIDAAGTKVCVRKIVYVPAVAGNIAVIQEYSPGGVARTGMYIKANAADINLVTLDWGSDGRELNGFVLQSIAGGTLYAYLGKD